MNAAPLVVSLVWGFDPDAPIAGSPYLQPLEILRNAHITLIVTSLVAKALTAGRAFSGFIPTSVLGITPFGGSHVLEGKDANIITQAYG